jgi:hypothetical protein
MYCNLDKKRNGELKWQKFMHQPYQEGIKTMVDVPETKSSSLHCWMSFNA